MRRAILAGGLLAAGSLSSVASVAADTYRGGTRVNSVGDSETKLNQIVRVPAFNEPIESKQVGHVGERSELDGWRVRQGRDPQRQCVAIDERRD